MAYVIISPAPAITGYLSIRQMRRITALLIAFCAMCAAFEIPGLTCPTEGEKCKVLGQDGICKRESRLRICVPDPKEPKLPDVPSVCSKVGDPCQAFGREGECKASAGGVMCWVDFGGGGGENDDEGKTGNQGKTSDEGTTSDEGKTGDEVQTDDKGEGRGTTGLGMGDILECKKAGDKCKVMGREGMCTNLLGLMVCQPKRRGGDNDNDNDKDKDKDEDEGDDGNGKDHSAFCTTNGEPCQMRGRNGTCVVRGSAPRGVCMLNDRQQSTGDNVNDKKDDWNRMLCAANVTEGEECEFMGQEGRCIKQAGLGDLLMCMPKTGLDMGDVLGCKKAGDKCKVMGREGMCTDLLGFVVCQPKRHGGDNDNDNDKDKDEDEGDDGNGKDHSASR